MTFENWRTFEILTKAKAMDSHLPTSLGNTQARYPLPPSPPHLLPTHSSRSLLQRNEPRTMRRANTRPPMFNRFITDRKLAQIKADHLRLDLDLVEFLARIDPRHHNHIPQMGFYQIRFLVRLRFLFRFAQFFDQAHGFAF